MPAHRLRSRALSVVVVAGSALLASAVPALATQRDDGDQPGEPLALAVVLGLFVGIPLLLMAVLAAFIYLPSMRSPRTTVPGTQDLAVIPGSAAASRSPHGS